MVIPDRSRSIASSVIKNQGLVNAFSLAKAMDITLKQLALVLDTKPKNLSESPTNLKIQESATKIVEMMDDLVDFLKARRFAVYWLHTPRAEFGYQSPIVYIPLLFIEGIFYARHIRIDCLLTRI